MCYSKDGKQLAALLGTGLSDVRKEDVMEKDCVRTWCNTAPTLAMLLLEVGNMAKI